MSNAKLFAKMLMVAGGLSVAAVAGPAAADAPCGAGARSSGYNTNPCNPCAPKKGGKKIKAKKANPCAANPCAANPCKVNPCKVNPCAANPCAASNPCKAAPCSANPCKANPCKPQV